MEVDERGGHIENLAIDEWVLIYEPVDEPRASIPLQIKGLAAPFVLATDLHGILHSLDMRKMRLTHANDTYVGNFLAFCKAKQAENRRKEREQKIEAIRAAQQGPLAPPPVEFFAPKPEEHPSHLPPIQHLWPGFPAPPPPGWRRPEDGESPSPVFI